MQNEKLMKKSSVIENQKQSDDELRPEYDLKSLLREGERGKYVDRYRAGTNLVLLDPDVAEAFPDAESVNEALRLVIQLTDIRKKDKAA